LFQILKSEQIWKTLTMHSGKLNPDQGYKSGKNRAREERYRVGKVKLKFLY